MSPASYKFSVEILTYSPDELTRAVIIKGFPLHTSMNDIHRLFEVSS